MPYPNVPDKVEHEAVVSPDKTAEYDRSQGWYPDEDPPEGVIVCHQETLFRRIVEEDAGTPVSLDDSSFEFYLFEDSPNLGVVGGFGIGAPEAVYVLERLIEFGVETFLVAELCGCFQPDIELGEIIVCSKAIRDEGTSYHYLPPSKFAYPSEDLRRTVEETLGDVPHHVGPSITTDAFYRDTPPEIEQYQSEGILSIEMEASAVFALAEFRDVDAAAMFVPSDYLREEWEQHWSLTDEDLYDLYEHARTALEEHVG
jgi:uridine phosphorylase